MLKSASAPDPWERRAAEMSTAWALGSLLAVSARDELEDLPNDYPLSLSEDEGDSDGERKHQQLLEAVTSLDGKKRWKFAERSEASLKVSEFTVSAEGLGERLDLSDLLEPCKTSSSLAAVRKQLNRVKSKTMELPFTQEEVERTHREVAFHETAQALSRWDPIVLKNRRAEQLIFPRKEEQSAFAPTEHMLGGWEAGTPLEQEIFNLLCNNKQPVRDPLLTPVEKASLKAMSLEEAKLRRAELQRARALQSNYEARARREKKIKSKKHHRVLKKGKAKKVLKEFEKLWKVSPPAALRDLEKLEKARVMERMSLKHQNSGKWAKSKAITAKYDVGARRALQEQLTRNKELTQKPQVASGSEEEEGGAEEEGDFLVPDVVHEAQVTADGLNPWMVRNHSGATKEAKSQKQPGAPKEEERKRTIDLQSILTTKSPSTESLAVPTTIEELEGKRERDHQQVIKEAFAGDDVIRDFLKEKRKAVEASKPMVLDLTLPGWGEWAGVGLKPSARKRHQFLIKAPEGPPRKDKNLPNVIISEKRNIHAAAHQVRGLPYPFTHHRQFERTIQTPIGSTWNTQRAFQKLTMPKVVTKPGHVIKPIKAEDVGFRSSSRSDLSVIPRNPRRLSICHQKQLKKNSEG